MAAPAWVVYTEDSGKDMDAVYFALVRKLATRLLPGVQTQRIDLRPARGEARAAMVKHSWKGNEPLRRALVNELATRLKTGDIAIFHHDGDTPWQGAPGAPAHDGQIERLLAEVRRRVGTDDPAGVVLRLVPHYSVESWLYLNRAAVDRVRDPRVREAALAWLDEHRRAESGFDHLDKPKDLCPLSNAHNLDLAQGAFPAAEAARASPSWRQVELHWARIPRVLAALQATIAPTS